MRFQRGRAASRPARSRPRARAARRATPRARVRLRAYELRAQARLRVFRRGSALAVGLTALLLLVWAGPETRAAQATEPPDASESLAQAALTLRDLFRAFYGLLPKIVVSILVLAVAILAARLVKRVLRRTLAQWERADALSALVSIALYLAAIAIALSVLAGDPGALLASIGLIGLALSWALQTPIESFTGWLVNSLRVYYRVGDRIEVGDVFGDVYKIDILTTTVWEAGGPGKAVAGAQPTGAMITFPNWEVLRSNIVNYSREFPFVWDEVTIGITNESDLTYAIGVFERAAGEVVGSGMPGAAGQYQTLLAQARVAFDVDERPRVFVSPADAWTNCTVRYLVETRYRRRRASDLLLSLSKAAADPAHAGRIVLAYPRTEVRVRDQWADD